MTQATRLKHQGFEYTVTPAADGTYTWIAYDQYDTGEDGVAQSEAEAHTAAKTRCEFFGQVGTLMDAVNGGGKK
jgi:hypothetical protein